MANSKIVHIVISILFGFMIFSGSIVSALGRPLKIEKKEQLVTTYGNSVQENIEWLRRHTLEFEADDFRPTDPGHSPGAGHSSPHANIVPKP
ncbi:hypothetical protein Lal_00001703 [Lupinus albus]|uniref:Putative encoded peptide n=1 Tax=Lupinus albus TaxID=3870 RepID=A0A6A4PPX3_LUPAL|nr:putative encoded peptide [Lupinus albus]KAF1893255.1 hypothetical protein Lal_00001703 [Lupinus albus]